MEHMLLTLYSEVKMTGFNLVFSKSYPDLKIL